MELKIFARDLLDGKNSGQVIRFIVSINRTFEDRFTPVGSEVRIFVSAKRSLNKVRFRKSRTGLTNIEKISFCEWKCKKILRIPAIDRNRIVLFTENFHLDQFEQLSQLLRDVYDFVKLKSSKGI